ncbi:MAG: hypothetical protein KF833_20535, partial [Verrucomicrobiae bacterium]|nr:hypothetical protein [Verrucomicrobiae bacterium]
HQSKITFGETNQIVGAGLGFPTGYVAKFDGEGGLISAFGMHGIAPARVAAASRGHYLLTGSKVGVGWVVAKYDRNDNLVWFIESSLTGNSRGNNLAVDAGGAVSLALWSEGTLPLGHNTYTSYGAGDFFLTRLSEDVAPVFVSQPAPSPFGLQLGSNVAFSPNVRSIHPVDFQWQNNGLDIPAATNVSIVITNCQLRDQGDYQLVARNRFGSTTSAVARLTIFFELRLRIQGTGRVDREPKLDGGFFRGSYPYGEMVRLTAVPDLGTSFSRWSGDHTRPDNPTQINISTNLSITAHFSDSVTNLVLDDDDAGVSVEGTWAVQHDGRGYSGGVYRVAGANAAPPVRVAYRPQVHLAGVYAVMAWMPSVVRAPQYGTALWDIPVPGGRSNVVVYQPRASGAWLKVADDVFLDGGTNDFLILSPGGDVPGLVVADAIRLVGQSIAPLMVAVPRVRAEGLWFEVGISTGAHVDLESTTNLMDWNQVREGIQFRDSGLLVPWADLHDGHRFFRVQIRP